VNEGRIAVSVSQPIYVYPLLKIAIVFHCQSCKMNIDNSPVCVVYGSIQLTIQVVCGNSVLIFILPSKHVLASVLDIDHMIEAFGFGLSSGPNM
jgi:hypothetical protein